ncbi:MAG: cytochrome c3 family protein [Planctomycetota bacterium]
MNRPLSLGWLLVLAVALCSLASTGPRHHRAPQDPQQDPRQDPSPRQAPTELAGRDCSTAGCHDDYQRGASVHAPVRDGQCGACHQPSGDPEQHAFEPITLATIPGTCHECHPREEPRHQHFPYRTGLCTQCHDPHRSDHPTLFRRKNDGSLCFQCHDREHIQKSKQAHGPVAVGACTLCHDVHGSDERQFLRAPRTDLCVSCHESMGRHIAAAEVRHPPVQQSCPNCHDPHGTDNGMHLKHTVPELCFGCHEDIRRLAQESHTPHGAIREPRSCLNCHNPHGAHRPKLLEDVPMTLCLKCHQKPLGKLVGIGEHLEKYTDHHGPIREGACPNCHNPHGSDNFRMLVRHYEPEFYTQRFELAEFSLCFGCHEQERVLEKYTDKVTGFRQGDRNLHYVHVNRDRKGRTCRACHDVHGSQHPFHIRDSVPFGIWDLPTNYEPLATGGRCTPGCHVTREYDRTGSRDKKY